MFTWESNKYQPVGRCIFCGATDDLTDEHIIPFGLLSKGGDWFLPKAACRACQRVSMKFEGAVQQGMLGPIRGRMGLKTRRKREPKLNLAFRDRQTGEIHHDAMNLDNLPLYALGFRFPEPGLLAGRPSTDRLDGECIAKGDLRDLPLSGGVAMKLGRVYPLDFCRMLAKIAHTYIWAEYGPDTFQPLLLDLIMGRSDHALHLVGGDVAQSHLEPDTLHHVYRQDCLSGGVHYVLAAIHLFAFMDMPRYLVVVGEKR